MTNIPVAASITMNSLLMRPYLFRISVFILILLVLFSCTKKTEKYAAGNLSDYIPLQSGKFIVYRTDSTVYTNFGRNTEIHSYQEEFKADSQITDNLGRSGYRIYRYLRDTAGTQPWLPSGSFMIIPTSNTVEVIENNLRFIKLTLPLNLGNTWNGNRFLPDQPFSSQYTFSNDDNMSASPDWNYTYTNTDTTLSLGGKTYINVLKVNGINEAINYPQTDPAAYAAYNYMEDNYAKGIGLIKQIFIMWEYQPNTGGSGGGFYTGFGIKRSILNYN